MSDPSRFFDYSRTIVPPVPLDRDTTALLVVDMQYSQLATDISPDGDAAVMRYFGDRVTEVVLTTIRELLSYFRTHGMHIVFVSLGSAFRDLRDLNPRLRRAIRDIEQANDVQDFLWSGSPGFAIHRDIEPDPGEAVIRKTTLGAFNGSDIEPELRRRGIQTLVVTGVSTNCCVETTVRGAADRGFACVVVGDGTADYDAEAHDAALRCIAYNFGRIVPTSAEMMRALDAGSPI